MTCTDGFLLLQTGWAPQSLMQSNILTACFKSDIHQSLLEPVWSSLISLFAGLIQGEVQRAMYNVSLTLSFSHSLRLPPPLSLVRCLLSLKRSLHDSVSPLYTAPQPPPPPHTHLFPSSWTAANASQRSCPGCVSHAWEAQQDKGLHLRGTQAPSFSTSLWFEAQFERQFHFTHLCQKGRLSKPFIKYQRLKNRIVLSSFILLFCLQIIS